MSHVSVHGHGGVPAGGARQQGTSGQAIPGPTGTSGLPEFGSAHGPHNTSKHVVSAQQDPQIYSIYTIFYVQSSLLQ